MSKPSLPRCVMATKDGSQCGRRVADGSQPPICSVHQQQAQGNVGALTQPVDVSPEDLLRKLLRDSDPAIRLRALQAWLDYQDKQKSGCDTCRARAEAEKADAQFIPALSDAERDEMAELMERWRVFKERMFDTYPHLEGTRFRQPVNVKPPVARAATIDPTLGFSTPERRPVVVDRALPEPEPTLTVVSTPQLSREHWAEIGIFTLRDLLTGKEFGVTHALGDEHAQKILSGEISLEDAQRQHRESQADGENFVSASLHKILTGAQS